MRLRPVDANGDILPVRSSGDLLSGAEAVALLVKDRLSLLRGEWWENPEMGFGILERLRPSLLTEAEAPAPESAETPAPESAEAAKPEAAEAKPETPPEAPEEAATTARRRRGKKQG